MSSKDGMPSIKPTGKLYSDEHGNHYTIETVAWTLVKFDPNLNVRPRSEYDQDKWGAAELVPMLRETKGVPKSEPAFHFDTATGELSILRGNRRFLAIEILRNEDPKEKGYQFVSARIYRDLSREQQSILRMDHAAREKPLSRYGLHLSIIECANLGMSEKRTIAVLRGALSDSYQPDRNVGKSNDDEAVFKQYRGFVRTCRWAHDIAVLERDWIEKCKDRAKTFPSNDVVEKCHKAFVADKAGERGALVNRDTPEKQPELVPTFMAAWNKAVEDKKETDARGGSRAAKGSGPMTATAIEALSVSSLVLTGVKAAVARKAKNPTLITDVLDPILVKLEKFLTPEDRAAIEVGMTGVAVTAPVVAKIEGTPEKKATGRKVATSKK
jgi:hypothetical protein